jgi:hypothetical protein
MRKVKKYLMYSIFILSIIGLLVISQIFQENNIKNLPYNYNTKTPLIKSSNGPLNSSDIYLNDTEIITLFDTIKIDLYVNSSQYPNANYTEIQFIYTDGTSFIDRMTPIGENFTYNYTAPYNVPTGIHSIYFQIYNDVDEMLNTNKTETTFTVRSNYYTAEFLKEELYIGDLLSVSLFIKNTTEHNFTYNIAIVDSTDEQSQINLKFIGNNIEWFNLTATEAIFGELNKIYYVKVNLTDQTTGKVNATYFPFQILNNNPQIIESTVSFSSLETFRSNVNNCRVSLNITDKEDDPANLSVILTLTNLFGTNKILFPLSNVGDNFSTEFHVSTNYPIGTYKVNITAKDQDGGTTSYLTEIEVKNNPPQFNIYLINGKLPTQSISVDYGEDIIFAFDIIDKDNNIEYITVTLISEDYKFLSISTENRILSINSANLESGVWYVYISATDSDGSTINLSSDYGLAPQQIKIIPNTLENLMPWITLIIGIVAGLLIGITLAYILLKSRKEIKEPPEEEVVSEEAPQKKKRKAEKPKAEAEKEEEEKEEKKPSKRKIKRKL